jgi:predicted NBD/HSP70 family sugar kinase/mannose-6-phosphate isomerase class I
MSIKGREQHFYVGIDIGGSHFTVGMVEGSGLDLIEDSIRHYSVNQNISAIELFEKLEMAIRDCTAQFNTPIFGIALSVPGPFDYETGTFCISGLDKYENLFGVNLKAYLRNQLRDILENPSAVSFINDADSFALGETYFKGLEQKKVIGVTLGTGIGSGFLKYGQLMTQGKDLPQNGNIYNLPFKSGIVEDWLSTRWILNAYKEQYGKAVNSVKEAAFRANTYSEGLEIFETFGNHLGNVLRPICETFQADVLLLGGGISKSFNLFEESFKNSLNGIPSIVVTQETSNSSILGAVVHLIKNQETLNQKRNTEQFLMPVSKSEKTDEGYQIYPSFELADSAINIGLDKLIDELPKSGYLKIDGYLGCFWDDFMAAFSAELSKRGIKHIYFNIASAYRDSNEIETMINPYLGGEDPVFGKIFPGKLSDFFDGEKIEAFIPDEEVLNIVYGSGASLSKFQGKLIYIDVPKNELQFRARAGNVINLGNFKISDKKKQYKQMYFVDWPVLNTHKREVLDQIDYLIDGQAESYVWLNGSDFRKSLEELTLHGFRARPWFEPGIWGGSWMKEKFKGLSQNVPNYAWSFELITPENGIVLSSGGTMLEISFDFLMFYNSDAILGDAGKIFGTFFPIRFDYLDTVNGQNLSVQCHPTQHYIQENFGEKFTQDETYYILDADEDAKVYLGFKEGVNKDGFKRALDQSQRFGERIRVEDYVQIFPSKKHDLFLIPNGTVHCSGAGNVVLEISSTPYIYTFKMYDWGRLDLDGNPRPLNIQRGVDNLDMSCQGSIVKEEYISRPSIVESGKDWSKIYLPTHAKHFYEIFRFEFESEIQVETKRQCHILNLVEGSKIEVLTGDRILKINYAETFVIPAAVGTYRIINKGPGTAKVIQANVKPEFCN